MTEFPIPVSHIFMHDIHWVSLTGRGYRARGLRDAATGRDLEVRACRGVGYALIELGRLDDAEADYRRCLTIAPGDKKSLGELAFIEQQRAKKK